MHPAEGHVRKLLKERGYEGPCQAGPGHDPEHGEIVLLLPIANPLVLEYGYKFNGGDPMWFVTKSLPCQKGWPPFPMPKPTLVEELAHSQDED